MQKFFLGAGAVLIAGSSLFFFSPKFTRVIQILENRPHSSLSEIKENIADKKIPLADIEPQPQLQNPPTVIKAVYATNWSAGNSKSIEKLIQLIKETEINAIVIDIKDYTGVVGYRTDLELVGKYGAEENRIPFINRLLKRLHDENIYVIGRIAVFEDQALATSRPELSLKSLATGKSWRTRNGLLWLDATSREVWDYNLAIAADALRRGFDEINLDYIRFPSDGNLEDISYPFWDKQVPRREVIKNFFAYVREKLPNAILSADLFGLVTINTDDLGIGQYLEYALPYFDYVSPMTYPSHYNKGFLGYDEPSKYPYEVVKNSMQNAVDRQKKFTDQNIGKINRVAKIRPWLQDFSLGVHYTHDLVQAQMRGVADVFTSCIPGVNPAGETKPSSPCASQLSEDYSGWMLWSPSNVYTREALTAETP